MNKFFKFVYLIFVAFYESKLVSENTQLLVFNTIRIDKFFVLIEIYKSVSHPQIHINMDDGIVVMYL